MTYRSSGRSPIAPTVIEYQTSESGVVSYVLLAVVFVVTGVVILSLYHATHVVCDRTPATTGVCRFHRYDVWSGFDREVPVRDISALEVTTRKGAKNKSITYVQLVATEGARTESFAVEHGGFMSMTETANEARDSFVAFQSHPERTHVDAWIYSGIIGSAIHLLLGGAFASFGWIALAAQIRKLRPVRIVVDHDQSLVVVRGRAIPFAEISLVDVVEGSPFVFKTSRQEKIPGFRIRILQRDREVFATSEFRASGRAIHEGAARRLRRVIGLEETPPT